MFIIITFNSLVLRYKHRSPYSAAPQTCLRRWCLNSDDGTQPRLIISLHRGVTSDLQRAHKHTILSIRDGGAVRKRRSVDENRVGCIVRGILSSRHSSTIIQFVADYTYIVIPSDEVEFTKRAKNLDLGKCAAPVWMGEAKEGQATKPARLDRRLEINVGINKVYAEGRRSERQPENTRYIRK
jgi:hypothetical protein